MGAYVSMNVCVCVHGCVRMRPWMGAYVCMDGCVCVYGWVRMCVWMGAYVCMDECMDKWLRRQHGRALKSRGCLACQ